MQELIELGAITILVPGNLPIGCLPSYLTLFESLDKKDYDHSTGCLEWLNRFSEDHNEQLLAELKQIQKLYPHAKIIYADYYNAVMPLYHSPNQFGMFIFFSMLPCISILYNLVVLEMLKCC
jgi:phospholipase/lecithinase/hemolysin